MRWEYKRFSQLQGAEVHEILCARQAVFVIEQQLICEDADELDLTSVHILGRNQASQELVAYARIHSPGSKYPEASFGRVLVIQAFRNTGLGKRLVQQCIDFCTSEFIGAELRISAQQDLERFYQGHGFKTLGAPYMEAGIKHIGMKLTQN